MAYGTSLIDLFHQGGVLVGKVLDGTKPEDLPVERPTRFQLVVPPLLLARADEVIE